MHNIHTRRPFVKKANLMMVLVVSVVVVLTMTALCAYSVIVSENELETRNDAIMFANSDATVDAVSHVVEVSIKDKIKDMVPDVLLPDEQDDWFDIDIFMSAHGDVIRQLVDTVAVVEHEDIKVEYRERVPHYIFDQATYYFDCIVVSITCADGITYNLSFYIKDSEVDSGDGLEREKGTYISTWIS